jgi:hypothetical protein
MTTKKADALMSCCNIVWCPAQLVFGVLIGLWLGVAIMEFLMLRKEVKKK